MERFRLCDTTSSDRTFFVTTFCVVTLFVVTCLRTIKFVLYQMENKKENKDVPLVKRLGDYAVIEDFLPCVIW